MEKESYLNSFVDDEDFTNKRFSKYVEKNINILNDFCETEFAKFSEEIVIKDDKTIMASPLDSFIINFFSYIYFVDNIDFSKVPFNFLINYEYSFIQINLDAKAKIMAKDILTNSKERRKILNHEIPNSCKDWLRRQEITKQEYFDCVPKSFSDKCELLKILINRVNIDLERMCRDALSNEFLQLLKTEFQKMFVEQLGEKDERIKELEYCINKINKEKDELIDNKKSEEKIKKEYSEIYQESNEEIIRQYNKLQNKYNKLVEKYNNIEEKEEIKEVPIIENEIDINKRYGFVITDSEFSERILEHFPNAVIVNDKTESIENIELIIFMTSYMGHPMYYKIKNKCKSSHIPYIHCNSKNIEIIKKIISINM